MHLLSALAAGMRNCENGSADVFRRGTSTPATVYSSFEGDPFSIASLDSNDRVTLDSYGRALVYVNEVVDVRCYNEAGEFQVLFTAGVAASAIEVRSQSFTGNDYDSGASATGNPTTLQAIMDLWLTTRRGTDWADTLTTQPFIIVTDATYGAKGDGTTDDTAAIQAAIAAAPDGGVLFFPPGTYRVSDTLVTSTSITLWGVGNAVLTMNHASNALIQGGGRIDGFTLGSNGTGILLDINVGATVTNCSLSGGAPMLTISGGTVNLESCSLSLGGVSSTGAAVTMLGGKLYASKCDIGAGANATYNPGEGSLVYGDDMHFDDCEFFASSASAGTFAYLKWSEAVLTGSVDRCKFNAATGATVTGIALGSYTNGTRFFETANNFASTVAMYSYTPDPDAGGVRLGTRENLAKIVTDNSASIAIPTDQYGVVIVKSSNTAASLTGTLPPYGSRGTVIFYHTSGGAGTATPTTNFFGGTAATTANTSTHAWEYVAGIPNNALVMLITVDGKALGNGVP